MKKEKPLVSPESSDPIVSHITHGRFGEIVFHLTPLGVKRHKLSNSKQARIRRYNKQQERNNSCNWFRYWRRIGKQRNKLIRLLKDGKVPTGHKHKCSACGKSAPCWKHRDQWFCVNCLKMNRKKEIEVICPRHKEWCGGKHGPCAGCLGESTFF